MNVCFLISDVSSAGGTERISFQVANYLFQQGHKVTFLSLNRKNQYLSFFLNEKIIIHNFFEDFSLIKLPILIRKIRYFLKLHSCELIVDIDSILTPYSFFSCLGLNIKHIVWEHFNSTINLGKKRRDWGRWIGAKFADKCIVLTEQDKVLWQQKYKTNNVITIYNPVTVNYANSITPIREKKIILAVGRLTSQKGFDLLLQAWNLLSMEVREQASLRIVGEGKERDALQAYIDNNKLNDSVELIGYSDKIQEQYQQAYAYVLSSRFEGFVLSLTEAMASGLPAIAFDCLCGPKELLINHSGLLVPNGNIDLFAAALQKLILNTELRNSLANNALKRSHDFSEYKILADWNTIIDNLNE